MMFFDEIWAKEMSWKSDFFQKHCLAIEIISIAVCIAVQMYILRPLLIDGTSMLVHDNLHGYPMFQFAAVNIASLKLPLWNPYSHGGEPFYFLIAQLGLLNPVSLVVLYLGQLFSNDIVMLFNWNHFVLSIIMVLGVYIVCRQFTSHLYIRLTLIPILLFSSIFLAPFRQAVFLRLFVWAPYLTYFLLKIFYDKDTVWRNWLIASVLIGLNWMSYYFSGVWVFLLFFFTGLLFFRRDVFVDLYREAGCRTKFFVSLLIIFLMMMPNLSLLIEKDKFVFPVRMTERKNESVTKGSGPVQHESFPSNEGGGIAMNYESIAVTGTFSSMWDFIQIISPNGNRFTKSPGVGRWKTWGTPSEAYMYLGVLPWFIALLGIVAGKHEQKKNWLLMLIGFVFLMLGPTLGLHRTIYAIYPPLWFIRHTHMFVLYFLFTVLYFYVIGFNYIFSTWNTALFYSRKGANEIFEKKIDSKRRFKPISFSRWFAFVLYTASIINIAYYLTWIKFPKADAILVSVIVICFLLRKTLRNKLIYVGLILSQIALVLILIPERVEFLCFLFSTCGITVMLFIGIKSLKHKFSGYEIWAPAMILLIFSVSLSWDLLNSFTQSNFLYHGQKHINTGGKVTTRIIQPIPPDKREVAPKPVYSATQAVRSASLLYYKAYVFSPIMTSFKNEKEGEPSFENLLKSKRWNSILMLRSYFDLIHSGIPIAVMAKMFTVGEPLFEFKKAMVVAEDDEIKAYLKHIGETSGLKLLSEYVFVDRVPVSPVNGEVFHIDQLKQIEINPSQPERSQGLNYELKRYGYSNLEIEIETDQPGFLYWSDGFDTWWNAYVDGIEEPVYRANINFKALSIPKGKTRVVFNYNPMFFRVALIFFYGTLLISLILVFYQWCVDKRKPNKLLSSL